jgi:hypothetical protein
VATDVCAPPFWSIKNSSIMPCEASGTDVPPCVNETGRRLGSSTVARRKRTKADWVTEHKILCQLERGPGERGQGRRSSPSSIPFFFSSPPWTTLKRNRLLASACAQASGASSYRNRIQFQATHGSARTPPPPAIMHTDCTSKVLPKWF